MSKTNNPLIQAVIEANRLDESQIRQLTKPFPLTPSTHQNFQKASAMIRKAIEGNQRIIICGDYDCDGLCGTSILLLTLRTLGADVGFYIPNRMEEGYGLNLKTATSAIEKGYRLFIAVDNGVSAFEALDLIRSQGCQSIVLDHHEMTSEVKTDCLIHPTLLEEGHRDLCGSGLAHQLSVTMIGFDGYITALAGIATIADMMPLWSYNRSLVLAALKEINDKDYLPIRTLLKTNANEIDEELLAFQLIPKLNAVGRLADQANVNRVVDYLCSTNPESIRKMAEQILEINQKRKDINQTMYVKALSMVDDAPVLILKDPDFHEGIVGITAGRLANELKRPVLILHENENRLKGSARSYGNQDLRSIFEPGSTYLSRYGGHAAAAGVEMPIENFALFKESVIKAYVPVSVELQIDEPVLSYDPGIVTIDAFKELKSLRPFGQGFKIPLFEVKDATVLTTREITGGVLYSLMVEGKVNSAVYFKQTLDDEVLIGGKLDFLCRISLDNFRNKENLKLMIERFS